MSANVKEIFVSENTCGNAREIVSVSIVSGNGKRRESEILPANATVKRGREI